MDRDPLILTSGVIFHNAAVKSMSFSYWESALKSTLLVAGPVSKIAQNLHDMYMFLMMLISIRLVVGTGYHIKLKFDIAKNGQVSILFLRLHFKFKARGKQY